MRCHSRNAHRLHIDWQLAANFSRSPSRSDGQSRGRSACGTGRSRSSLAISGVDAIAVIVDGCLAFIRRQVAGGSVAGNPPYLPEFAAAPLMVVLKERACRSLPLDENTVGETKVPNGPGAQFIGATQRLIVRLSTRPTLVRSSLTRLAYGQKAKPTFRITWDSSAARGLAEMRALLSCSGTVGALIFLRFLPLEGMKLGGSGLIALPLSY